MVASLPVPRALTVMLGVAPANVRILAAFPLLDKIQPAGLVGLASPKINLPMVRGESRPTVRSAVRSMLLKSAVIPVPFATRPPPQLVVVLHRLLPSLIQAAFVITVTV